MFGQSLVAWDDVSFTTVCLVGYTRLGDRENRSFQVYRPKASGDFKGLASVFFDLLRGGNPDTLSVSGFDPSPPIELP